MISLAYICVAEIFEDMKIIITVRTLLPLASLLVECIGRIRRHIPGEINTFNCVPY